MKTLFVLRHAKSSWDYPELADFERPLNKRGKKAAPFMGDLMRRKGLIPEFILSSSAKRAKQTAKLVKASAEIENDIHFDRQVYGASTNTLLHIVGEFENGHSSAMIVGHNPGFEGLVEVLGGEYQRMPTAALAVIELEIDTWHETAAGKGILVEILRPKEQM
ncbi:MAG: histidine phosphatase family protein [Pyrinomonadaceae bacterium]|nr:histidine phosphatase family protein [Pyrinomonadaceae bacterium]